MLVLAGASTDMTMAEVGLTFFLASTLTSQVVLEAIIVASLASKPLNLQTAIDWTVIDFVVTCIVVAVVLFVYFLQKIWSFALPDTVCVISAVVGHFSLTCLPLFFLACTLLRHLTVFHLDHHLQQFTDKTVHLCTRYMVMVLSAILAGVSIYFGGFPMFYQELRGLTQAPTDVAARIVIAGDMILGGGLSLIMLELIQREKQRLHIDQLDQIDAKIFRYIL